jgi:hypothetical protein
MDQGYTPWGPLDPNGAVGPNHICQIINTNLAIFTKSGQFIESHDLSSYSGGAGIDPTAVYDPAVQRWVICSGLQTVYFAVSDTSDPTQGWSEFHSGIFADAPDRKRPGHTDLGVWSVFANPDMPNPQGRLRLILLQSGLDVSDAALLERSIACFKTPSLRDLGHSAPYLHNGAKDSLEAVLDFYRQFSAMARKGQVRNADPKLANIFLATKDVAPLAAFLRSLNKDYDD